MSRAPPITEDALELEALVGLVDQMLNGAQFVDQPLVLQQLSYLMQPQ
jgi:hypothetical protein